MSLDCETPAHRGDRGQVRRGQGVELHDLPEAARPALAEEEGLVASVARHKANHLKLAAGLSDLGLELAVAEEWRLPQLNSVSIPEGMDDATVRGRLLNEFDLEVGAGLGELAGKQWRIGLMGSSSNDVNINRCLRAFEAVLS